MKRQLVGYGLVEVLVSIVLTNIILIGLVQLYLVYKKQYQDTQHILAAQYDLLWLSDLLSDSIRRAGFTPCLGIEQLETIDRRSAASKLVSFKFTTAPTSSLQINRMSEAFNQVVDFQNAKQLISTADSPLKLQSPILIADCEHAEVQEIAQIEKHANSYHIILSKPLQFHYTNPVYVGEWLEESWFIKKHKDKKSLYYKLFQTEELSTVVHSLEFKSYRTNNKQLVELLMGLDGSSHKLLVTVRGS